MPGPERIFAADPNFGNLTTGSFPFAAPVVFDGAWFSDENATSIFLSMYNADGLLLALGLGGLVIAKRKKQNA